MESPEVILVEHDLQTVEKNMETSQLEQLVFADFTTVPVVIHSCMEATAH